MTRWRSRPDCFACGIGLGLAALVRVIAGVLVLPLVVVLFFTGRSAKRGRRLWNVGALLMGFALVLAPWVVRNFDTSGHLAVTSQVSCM